METCKTKLRVDYPDILTSMYNLVYTLKRLSRFYEALDLMDRCASLY